jgi:hypothetical protein
MKKRNILRYIFLFMVAPFVLASCNGEFEKMIPESPGLDTNISFRVPKVLFIIADGARGTSVRDAASPVLQSLLRTSIYSWNGLSDTSRNNATNWASMLTGVGKDKHGVLGDSFAGSQLGSYPVVFKRIKDVNPDARVASFASSELFKEKLTAGADVSESFGNDDEALKVRMAAFIRSDNASLILGQFSGIETAGKASGFDNSFPAYKDAIKSFDTRVGELIEAVKGRTNYKNENWLVVITSTRGGNYTLPLSENDKTIFSNTYSNIFTIIHNPSFKQTFIARPFLGSSFAGKSMRFMGDSANRVGLVSPELSPNFNFGTEDDFTVSVKIRKNKNLRNTSRGDFWYTWPSILGKRNNVVWGDAVGGGPGWDICLYQNRWRFFVAGGTDFVRGAEVVGLEISGDSWHDLTAVVEKKADGFRYIRIYTDGVLGVTNNVGGVAGTLIAPLAGEVKLAGQPNFDNGDPMRIGYAPGESDAQFGKIDVNMTELKIWKVALPEQVIKQYACDVTMNRSHPYYDYLVGYWPLNEGAGNKMADQGPFAAHFNLKGSNGWENFNDLICSPRSENLNSKVPNGMDMSVQVLNWLNITRQENWKLDGRVWVSN